MCSTGHTPKVEAYKAATPAATPPSPTEGPTAPEPAESATKKKKAVAKGKLALRSDISTPSGVGLNTFSQQ